MRFLWRCSVQNGAASFFFYDRPSYKVPAQSTGLVGMSYAQAGALCNITKEVFGLSYLRTSFSGFDKKTENPSR
jgi:hypothetical protein